ncbi:hypothetical protein WR25_19434 [Diploscapter pachys]|uniref:Uncharacterized protein n=1 Tax=Diploscapter pachys TaxID=2018661 RepID=A0A2A2LDI7_9BILA|nr:hypothetical protein WR25_19434 [Diploscapter pachys]
MQDNSNELLEEPGAVRIVRRKAIAEEDPQFVFIAAGFLVDLSHSNLQSIQQVDVENVDDLLDDRIRQVVMVRDQLQRLLRKIVTLQISDAGK